MANIINPIISATKAPQSVEFLWKSTCKSPCISRVKNVYYFIVFPNYVQNPSFPPAFPTIPTVLPTTKSPLSFTVFFHYSTTPTITTTNNKIIRKD